MSTQPPPVPRDISPTIPGEQHKPPGDIEIRVFSHSGLFYWWPVWAAGLILGTLSWASGHMLAIVPKDTKQVVLTDYTQKIGDKDKTEFGKDTKEGEKGRAALVYPARDDIDKPDTKEIEKVTNEQKQPHFHIANDKNFGIMFAIVLLIVIVVTNVPLRGMWSLVVIITLVLLSIIFALANTWEWIFEKFSLLAIYMNAGGYFFISIVLLILWSVAMFVFDRQVYMIFTPGQFRMCHQIGGGEQVFSTEGMTLEKQRSDLFRHWILGLGSGDMVVKTARGDHFDLHNVLFVGRKVAMIEDMMREKAVVRGH
jgi:hypothetical protein